MHSKWNRFISLLLTVTLLATCLQGQHITRVLAFAEEVSSVRMAVPLEYLRAGPYSIVENGREVWQNSELPDSIRYEDGVLYLQDIHADWQIQGKGDFALNLENTTILHGVNNQAGVVDLTVIGECTIEVLWSMNGANVRGQGEGAKLNISRSVAWEPSVYCDNGSFTFRDLTLDLSGGATNDQKIMCGQYQSADNRVVFINADATLTNGNGFAVLTGAVEIVSSRIQASGTGFLSGAADAAIRVLHSEITALGSENCNLGGGRSMYIEDSRIHLSGSLGSDLALTILNSSVDAQQYVSCGHGPITIHGSTVRSDYLDANGGLDMSDSTYTAKAWGLNSLNLMHTITNSAITLDCTGLQSDGMGFGGDALFSGCTVSIRSSHAGLILHAGVDVQFVNCDLTIDAASGTFTNQSSSLTLLGGKSVITGEYYGVTAGQLTIMGGDHTITGQRAAVAVNSYSPKDNAIVLGTSTTADAPQYTREVDPSFCLTSFGQNLGFDWFEEDPLNPHVRNWALHGAAKTVHFQGNGEFDASLALADREPMMGTRADFTAAYACGGNDLSLTYALPAGLELISGSVTENGKPMACTLKDGLLTVQPAAPEGVVRFSCAIVKAGEYEVGGQAAYRMQGEEVTKDIPALTMTAKAFTLDLPSRTSRTELSVRGKAVPGSRVTLYDNGSQAGSATADLAGSFAADIQISTAASHKLTARIYTPDQQLIEAGPIQLSYDASCAEVERVVMKNLIHGSTDGEIIHQSTTFDFTDLTGKKPRYDFWPDFPEISFEVTFRNCRNPLAMGEVYVVTTDHGGSETRVPLTYNMTTQTWYGAASYSVYTMPEALRVAYTGENTGSIVFHQADGTEESIPYRTEGDTLVLGDTDPLYLSGDGDVFTVADASGEGLRLTALDENSLQLTSTDGVHLADMALVDENTLAILAEGRLVYLQSQDGETLTLREEGVPGLMTLTGQGYTLTDGTGADVVYTQGENGVTDILYPDGTAESFRYDEEGQLTDYTARDGQSMSMVYTAEGDLRLVTRSDGSSLLYTHEDNTVTIKDESNRYTHLTFNRDDQLTEVRYPGGRSIRLTYDDQGNIAAITDPFGVKTTYAYDQNGALVRASSDHASVTYAYGKNGELVSAKTANGASTSYAYDARGLLTGLTNRDGQGGTVDGYQAVYDEYGLLTALSAPDGAWAYTYDNQAQLLTAAAPDGSVTAFAYTEAGTLASVTAQGETVNYTSGDLGQIVQKGDTAYAYDRNGQLIRETSPEGETHYAWNILGQLTRVEKANGDVYEYGYDVFGNRNAVTINGETTRYIWLPTEVPVVVAAILPDGTQVSYLQGNGLAAETVQGRTTYYQYNLQGSATALTNGSGVVTATKAYDVQGLVTASTGEWNTPFGYVGQYGIMSDGSGLWHMRARDVSQSLGTFVSADPAGQVYDWNLYRYANNNRVMFVDISGETATDVSQLLLGYLSLFAAAANLPLLGMYVSAISLFLTLFYTPEEEFNDGAWWALYLSALGLGMWPYTFGLLLAYANLILTYIAPYLEKEEKQPIPDPTPRDEVLISPKPTPKPQDNVYFEIEDDDLFPPPQASEYFESDDDAEPTELPQPDLEPHPLTVVNKPYINNHHEIEYRPTYVPEKDRLINTGYVYKAKGTDESGYHYKASYMDSDRNGYMAEVKAEAKVTFQAVVISQYNTPSENNDEIQALINDPDINEELRQELIDSGLFSQTFIAPEILYVSPTHPIQPQADPSGYVYEAVPANRLSGVTTTLYYKPTLDTPDEEAVLWDAPAYGQENPLTTNTRGQYQWMVGAGWYQVVYEKAGYETARSAWLPVPPVQTDVNVGLTNLSAPVIVKAYAQQERAVLVFDRYVQRSSATPETIRVHTAAALDGFDVIPLDTAFTPEGMECARTFSVGFWNALPVGADLTVTVDGLVSYAGVPSGAQSAQVTTAVQVASLQADSVTLAAGMTGQVTFTLEDVNGKPVSRQSLIVTVPKGSGIRLAQEQVTTNGSGLASIPVTADAPGTSLIQVRTVDGSFTGNIAVSVRQAESMPEGYKRLLREAEAWYDDLIRTWTDGRKESMEIAQGYVDQFTAESDRIRALLSPEQTEARAQLDAWDNAVENAIYSTINGLFTQKQMTDFNDILYQRCALAWMAAQ